MTQRKARSSTPSCHAAEGCSVQNTTENLMLQPTVSWSNNTCHATGWEQETCGCPRIWHTPVRDLTATMQLYEEITSV
eukprot:1161214-Pelagomonas_calceolata.AAC.7